MNKFTMGVMVGFLMFAVMSCGLVERFTGGDKLIRVNDLWGDVPRMDGLSDSQLELPFGIKLLMRTALNNLWRFNKDGEDKTPVSGDWTVYTLNQPPAEVSHFYTSDRMSSYGKWETGKESTCFDGKDKGFTGGTFCVFHKVDGNKEAILAIVAATGEADNKSNVFFLRLEKEIPPGAKESSKPSK